MREWVWGTSLRSLLVVLTASENGIPDKLNVRTDPGCGGPFPSSFPGGAASPSSDKNSISVVDMDRLTATPNSIVPVAEGISLPRENICDDGKDNDRNGLKDYEDPDCARISDTGMKDSLRLLLKPRVLRTPQTVPHNTLPQKSVIELEANVADDDNTYFISISGGHDRDIRTISFSQDYGYSPQEL